MTTTSQTTPIYSQQAEESLLGAIIINPGAYLDVADIVRGDDFYIHRHRFIWQAIVALSERCAPLDLLTLGEELERFGHLEEIGGPGYLTGLINQVPSSLNAGYYAQIIEQNAVRRRLLHANNQAAKLAFDQEKPLDEVIDEAERIILEAGERKANRPAKALAEVVSRLFDKVAAAAESDSEMLGLPTGFVDLDKLLKGLQGGNLAIVAGRPGTGKTSFMLSLAHNIAQENNKRIALFSLEMSDEELGLRLLAMETGIDSQRLRSGKLSADEWALFTAAAENIAAMPILIDDTPVLTPMQLRTKCRRLHAEAPLDLVIVDYLQLMNGGGRFENRQVEVAYISRQIKALAKELNIPILTAAQLSRAVEGRADKRPLLSDLRESGSIEQDADVVIFLSRQSDGNLVDVELAKHRNGPTGLLQLVYRPAQTKFENAARRMP